MAEVAEANGLGEEGRVAMPSPAIPEYLRKAAGAQLMQNASPGLRFGLLLPIWNSRWRKEK